MNSANQNTQYEKPIAIVRASDVEEACRTIQRPTIHPFATLDGEIEARVSDLNVWTNQRLRAVPESEANPDDWNDVLTTHAQGW